MDMNKGFTVIANSKEEESNLGFRAACHKILDEVIDGLWQDRPNGEVSYGGGAEIVIPCKDHNHTFKLTLADTTGQVKCVWCNGTGVEGS